MQTTFEAFDVVLVHSGDHSLYSLEWSVTLVLLALVLTQFVMTLGDNVGLGYNGFY